MNDAAKIAALENRVAELEELCGLQDTLAPNPFSGPHRVRLLVIAKLFASRELVSKDAISFAIGGSDMAEHTSAVYVSHLRKQLSERGIKVKTEWGCGWSLAPPDRDKLRSIIQGASA